MSSNSLLNGITKFGERFGYPAAVTLVLLGILSQGIQAMQKSLHEHDAKASRLLYALCLNLADSPDEAARCEGRQ